MKVIIDMPEACKPIDMRNHFSVGDRVSCLPYSHRFSGKKGENTCGDGYDKDDTVDIEKNKWETGEVIFVSPYFISVKMKYYTESFSSFDYKRRFVYEI